MKERGDRLDLYRRESNQILLDKMAQSNNLVQEKYITLSIPQRKIEDSRAYFAGWRATCKRASPGWIPAPGPWGVRSGCGCSTISSAPGEEEGFAFDTAQSIRQGVELRDVICPDSLSFKADYFEMGNMVGRVLFLKSLSSYLKDDLLSELSDFPGG